LGWPHKLGLGWLNSTMNSTMVSNADLYMSVQLTLLYYCLPHCAKSATIDIASEKGAIDMMTPLKAARREFERQYLTQELERCGGNVATTAVAIGMERSALHRKLTGLGVSVERGQRLAISPGFLRMPIEQATAAFEEVYQRRQRLSA
jgi:DNA-binding NtrC family response regulator